MKKIIIAILLVSGLVGTGAAIWYFTLPQTEETGKGGDKRAAKPTPVRVATVARSAVPIVLDAVANAEAEQSVAVRAEVGGVLQKIYFREGDPVKAGQLLFQLEAAQARAEADKAHANLLRDQAAANEARAQMQRLQPLAEMEYVTRQEYAQAVAQEQAATATVRADRAALQAAQVQLAHARISAPISGRAGILNVKQGNLLSANQATPLVTINATDVLLAAFSVPQQHLQAIREARRKGPLAVEVRREAGQQLLGTGTLAFIDNAVDAASGTIRLKARVPNRDEAIWPGELLALRLILGVQTDALVVPETALKLGQSGAYVYVLADGKVHLQPVKVARQLGAQVVIAEGLREGQQVIVNVPGNLRPGAAVEVMADKGDKARAGKQP